MSGTEPIILVPTSRDYPPIVTVQASPTMDQDRPDETLYSRASPLVQATGDIEQPTCPRPTNQLQIYTRVNRPVTRTTAWLRQPNPTTVRPAQLQVRETSPDGSMNRTTGDTEQPRDISREELDCLLCTSEAALYSAEDSISEPNLACGQEQVEYQYRPMTPGEEETLRIYENGISCLPDMIEKPGGLWITCIIYETWGELLSTDSSPATSCRNLRFRVRRTSERYSGNIQV